jgi:hypothetical protein
MAKLNSIYMADTPSETDTYLTGNADLLVTLEEIPSKLAEFGLNGELHIEFDDYPDSQNDQRLIVSIHAKGEPSRLMDALESFDEGWWLDQLPEVGSRVCIVLRFQ